MNIGVLGTGMVGSAIATKLLNSGYDVMMGSRTENNEKALAWQTANQGKGETGTFAQAAKFADIIFNCTQGIHALEALKAAGKDNIGSKILVDVSNALDFSQGNPPVLAVCNTDSLGEQIQRNFPNAKVVKTLNTVNCEIMVDPHKVNGDHDIFMSGNDTSAKKVVRELLQGFGWDTIHDLGDITTARGTEQLMPIWMRLWNTLGHANFNFHIAMN